MAGYEGKRRYARKAWKMLRRFVLDRDGWRCTKCGRAGAMEVHHVKPIEDGGLDEPGNLVTLCRGCHIAEHRTEIDTHKQAFGELAHARL